MKLEQLIKFLYSDQELLLVADWSTPGFYRETVDSVKSKPVLLGCDVDKIYIHENGYELIVVIDYPSK